LPVPPSQRLDGERRRRARAEPDDHAILHQGDRGGRGRALERVPFAAGLRACRRHACTSAAMAVARTAAMTAA